MSLRKLMQAALVVAALTIAPASSGAAPILISGDASACFGVGCTPGDTASYLGGLIQYTSEGVLDFLGVTDPVAGTLAINSGTGSFGRLQVGTAFPYALVNTPFSLLLDFYSPTAPDAAFSATIVGVLSLNSVGGLVVAFNPMLVSLPFTSGSESGTLDVYALPTAIASGGSGQLTGYMVAHSVPEPSTSMLLGLGALIFAAARKRRA